MQAKKLTIALCQVQVTDSYLAGNLTNIERALQEAKSKGADLVVFPESCLLGWINPEAHHLACPIPGKDSDTLCDLAKRFEMNMVIGLDEQSDGNLYGAAIAISSEGVLLAKHRKANVLPKLMEPPYASSASPLATMATFPFGKVALLICADTFVEASIDSVAKSDAELLVVPYGWATADDLAKHGTKLHELISNLALRLGIPVVGVDAIGEVSSGPWKGRRYCGASAAADADGCLLTQPSFGNPAVLVSQNDLAPKLQANQFS